MCTNVNMRRVGHDDCALTSQVFAYICKKSNPNPGNMKKVFSIVALAVLAMMSVKSADVPEWLRSAVIYHIYPSTYADSDGDGIGDLEGIRSHLDYIRATGFNTIWISPVFESQFEDGGYDITDFYKVDPRFGTNQQLVDLVKEAHAKGIKVCLDLVAGHT